MAAPAPPTSTFVTDEESALSQPVTTGEVAQNGPKSWERAWSVQEMRTEAGYWSLAGDAGLFNYLQEFSQRLISRSHEIGQEMDVLVHESKLTSVRVNNVINNFIMLANTQFVENRVYDEDMAHVPVTKEDKKLEQQEKTREQREAELIPRVISALKLGIDVIDTAFEKVETMAVDSDSEEEDNAYQAEPVLEAKDPYMTRNLPFLIGSPQFMEDDSVGLVEELSEEEEESDHGNISVSEDEDQSEESETEYSSSEDSDDDDKQEGVQKRHRARTKSSTNSSDNNSDEDMFPAKKTKKFSDGESDNEYSDEEETERNETAGPSGGPTDFTSELAARIGAAVPKRHTGGVGSDEGEGEEDEWGAESVEHKSKETASFDKEKHPKNIKKGKKDKENVEGKAEKGKVKGKHSKFEDEEGDLFGESDRQDEEDLFGKSGGLFSSGKGVFDDDEEGDLFGDVEKPATKAHRKKSAEKERTISEKEDEETEVKKITDTRPRTKSGKLLPTGAVSVFGGAEEMRKTGLFDENEEDDLFGSASERTEAVTKEKRSSSKSAATKKVDLFADDGDDEAENDLFGSLAAPTPRKKSHSNVGLTVEGYEEKKVEEEKPTKKVTPEKKLPPGAVSMFGNGPNPFVAALKKQQEMASSDYEDSESWDKTNHHIPSVSSLLKTAERKNSGGSSSRTSSIKEGDGEGDLFSSRPKADSKTSDKPGKNLIGNNSRNGLQEFDKKKAESSKPVKGSLFDDDDDAAGDSDNDFFTPPVAAKPVESGKPAIVPVLGGADAVKVAKGNQGASNASKSTSQSTDKKKTSVSLFDDEEDDESAEPLFSGKPLQLPTKKDGAKSKVPSLFDDDELLFSSGLDENPSVDLFSNQGPLSQPSQVKDTPKLGSSTVSSSASATSVPPKKEIAATKSTTTSVPPKKEIATTKPTTTNLFGGSGGDDDEDDLFSSGHLTKSLSTAVAASKVIVDGIQTESTDAMETKEEEVKPEVKKPKKPAGAVSMFGGLDPSALLKKRRPPSISDEENDDTKDDKEAKKEKSPEMTPVSKPKPSADLFSGDNEGDAVSDDIFSPKTEREIKMEGATTDESTDTPDKEEAATPKPEPTKPKKPAGAVSMFGSLDPSAILKRRKVEEPEEKEDQEENKEKPSPPEPAAKPKVSPTEKNQENAKPKPPTDLFGTIDDDDDLFGAPKKKVPPPTAPKSPAPTPSEGPKPQIEIQSPEQSKVKKPAGAVSIFGGIDPFAGMKKKSLSVEEEDEKESSPTREEQKSSSSAMLSPDGTKPSLGKSLERADSVDFDQPAETGTLASASKDRAKLSRRRPQSRKARMLAVTHTGISFEDVTPTTPTTPTIPEVPDFQDFSSLDPVTSSQSPADNSQNGADEAKSKPSDLFGNDDLFDGHSFTGRKPQAIGDEKPLKDDFVFSKDLFDGNRAKTSSQVGKDLFSDSDNSAPVDSPVKSKTSFSKSPTGRTSKKNEVQDDLFSKPVEKSKPSDVSAVLDNDDLDSPLPVATGQKTKAVPSLDDEDDLFASSSVKSPTGNNNRSKLATDAAKMTDSASQASSSEANSQTKPKVLATSPGHDDIFGDSSPGKQKDGNKKSGTRSAAAKKDDLVGSKSTTTNVRPKRAVTKEVNLLSDATDIFNDIPDPTPREPKKKATRKTAEKKPVFKDDVDDIFAETSAAAIKPKKETKKKETKPTTGDTDNIFDDPLS